MKKKLFIIFLTVCMAIVTMTVMAFAADSDYEYTASGTITKYKGTDTEITIPSSLGGYTVVKIGDNAFKGTSVTKVTIPDTVTSIGKSAFNSCTSLTSISIPDSVTSIGEGAFKLSGLTSVTIPSSVTSIGVDAFSYCESLTSVLIPDSVTSIGNYAFSNCTSLETVTIESCATIIGTDAFRNTPALTNGNINQASHTYDNGVITEEPTCTEAGVKTYTCTECGNTYTEAIAATGHSYDTGTVTKEATCTENGEMTYTCTVCGYSYTEVIPATGHNYVDHVCTGCGELDCIAFGTDWVLEFDHTLNIYSDNGMADWTDSYRDTYGSSVESVVIDSAVTYIARFAFYGCSNLTSVTIPDSVTDIGNHAFSGCTSLASIEIPSSVTGIYEAVFEYCTSLTSITIPNSIKSIGTNAFYHCTGLTSIEIPSSVTSIGQSAFAYCEGLTSITISNSVTSIGSGAFCFCTGLTSVTIPDSVTTLAEYAFEACTSLESVVIGNGITTINNNTFYGCSSLESVYISSSVTSIGRVAFYPDWGVSNSILDVYYEGSSTNWNAISISDGGNENLTDAFIHYNCTSIHTSHVHGSTYEWSSDYTTCTVTIYCSECDSTKEIECTVESKEVTAVSCTMDGTAYCTATATIANEIYSETQTVVTATATGHTTEIQNAKDATCIAEGYNGDEVCTVCGETITTGTVIAATGNHTYDTGVVTKEATCTEDGEMTYTCTVCGDSYTETIAATGHSYGEPVFTWNGNTCTATFTCTEGDDVQTVDATVTSKNFFGMVTRTAEVTFGGTPYTDTKTTGRSLLTIMADYTSVNNAISKANALNASDYSNFADVTAAINAVQWNLNVLNQSTVNGYAEAIETAIANLKAAELTEETVTINEPIEDTNTETEPDDIDVDDTDEETNPTTGIALAMLPMAIALAATVANKRG
ncbi:MAG: leucine-rich repeat domain-containing protein [Oscillospiraceae bacterium]|nr:leucine-rich repeat domain-containing protein [Oscillospiraceae bacterium]